MSLIALLVLAAVAVYFMTPEERLRLIRSARGVLRIGVDVAATCRLSADDPFYGALRARMRWPLVTYALLAVNAAVLVGMILAPGTLGDGATLVAWGGNFGPRTTDGEPWRVFTSIFVHRGVLSCLVNVIALLQLGVIVERIVGPFTFGTIVMTAGAMSSIMSVAAAPMSVVVGGTGAVFGAYGLLLAAAFRGLLRAPAVRIPLSALKTLAPVTVAFVLFWLTTEDAYIQARAGLCAGIIGGIVLTRSMHDYRARLRRFAVLGGATASIVLMSAMAIRAVTEVRPVIAAVVATEARTVATYDAAIVRFRNGRSSARDLAQIIEGSIAPDVQRERARVHALADIAPSDEALVADTQEYLRLRAESWTQRADALRRGNMRRLREAGETERASLRVFERVNRALAK